MILRKIFNLINEILFGESSVDKESAEKIKQLNKEIEKLKRQIEFKKGEMYVVNVCILYFVSNKEILLTSSEWKLLTETKKLKYRPIVIVKVSVPDVYIIALSTDKNYKSNRRILFDNKNCNFVTKDCFLPKIDKKSFIFEIKNLRKRKGKISKQNKRVFPIPISILRNLTKFEASSYKNKAMEICEIHENYKFIKKCANCNINYINEILDQVEKS